MFVEFNSNTNEPLLVQVESVSVIKALTPESIAHEQGYRTRLVLKKDSGHENINVFGDVADVKRTLEEARQSIRRRKDDP